MDLRRLWHNHSLTVVALLVGLFFLASSSYLTYNDYADQQAMHGQPVEFSGFMFHWWSHITHELVGEVFIGVLAMVWLTKSLREKDSPESGD